MSQWTTQFLVSACELSTLGKQTEAKAENQAKPTDWFEQIGPLQTWKRRWVLSPESMRLAWRISLVAATGRWAPWLVRLLRTDEIASDPSCGAWVYKGLTKNHTPHRLIINLSILYGLSISTQSEQLISNGPLESPLSRYTGYLYLVAIMNLFSRQIPSWKLPTSLNTQSYLEAWKLPWLL